VFFLKKFFCFLICFVLFFFSCFALVPSVSSSTHSNQNEWYSENSISLNWSLNGASTCAFVLDKFSDTVPDISLAENSFSVEYRNKKEDIYFFHVKCKNSSGWSDVAHYKIQIDKQGPSRTENILAEPLSEGGIKISWDSVFDEGSGVDYYNVYRSNVPFVRKGDVLFPWRVYDYVAVLIGEKIKENFFIDDDVCDGCRRHYKVQAVDFAGNIGIESQSVTAVEVSVCDVTFEYEYFFNEDDFFEASVYVNGGENEGVISKPSVFLVFPDGSEKEIFSSSNYLIDLVDFNYDFSNEVQGSYLFRIEAEDADRDFCSDEWLFFFDKVSPEINLISSLPVGLEETVEIEVKVSDAVPSSGVDLIEFYLNDSGFKKIGESSEKNSSGNFVFSWDTLNSPNGRRELKIKAIDNAGNESELIEIVSINNTLDLRNEIIALYDEIDVERKKFLDLKNIFELHGIEFDFENVLVSVDLNLVESKSFFDSGIYVKSKNHALIALNSLKDVLNKIEVTQREPLRYVFNKSDLPSLYASAGLLPEFVDESIENISSFGFSRKLIIQRIVFQEETFYFVSIEIVLYNNSDLNKSIFLIESVPSEFARNASFISSEHELVFVNNNPVFYSFLVLPSKENFVFTYNLNKSVSFEELIDLSNSINLFDSPSAIVSSDKSIPGNVFSKPLNFEKLFFDLINLITLNNSIPLWLVLIVVVGLFVLGIGLIVIFLVVLIVYFLFFKKKSTQKTLRDV
jgi:hypothetical protein